MIKTDKEDIRKIEIRTCSKQTNTARQGVINGFK